MTARRALPSAIPDSEAMADSISQDYRDLNPARLDATDARDVLTVGLVPSPGQCARIANDIRDDLPNALARSVDGDVEWEVKVITDSLTGSNVETPRLLHEIDAWREKHGWDMAIAITDLPVHDNDSVVVAEASSARQLAWVSVPPLGVFRLRRRTLALVVELVDELRGKRGGNSDAPNGHGHADVPGIGPRLARSTEPSDNDRQVDMRYVAPRLVGQLRLLAGMVYANRPWSVFPSFKTTIATAFATGGYGLIFSTLWKLGNIYEVWRLILLMVVAMTILIGWIIISHGLWESRKSASSRYLRTLYNAATVLTITSGVVFAYVFVFVMLLSAALVYIPNPMLEQTIQQPVTPASFLRIAWITTSVATIAGAVGAGLEDTDAVREATFGWRQHHRFQEFEDTWGDDPGKAS